MVWTDGIADRQRGVLRRNCPPKRRLFLVAPHRVGALNNRLNEACRPSES